MQFFCLLWLLLGTSVLLPAGEVDVPELSAGRTFHRAINFGDTIVVLGGFETESAAANKRIDLLDQKSGKWAVRKAPFEHEGILLPAVADENLYVLDPTTPAFRRYNLAEDKWTKLAMPLNRRTHPALVGFQGKLLLIGGYNGEVTTKNCVEIYDPTTDSWEIGTPLPGFELTDHFHLTAVTGSNLHVVGHYFGGKEHWVFDGKTWKRRADAPVACGWKSAALEPLGGKLYLIEPLQDNPDPDGNAVFVYSPAKDRWESMGPVADGYPFSLSASASYGASIIVLGGFPMPSKTFLYDVKRKTWLASP